MLIVLHRHILIFDCRLATIGEWHEFESKALRKEKERRERDVARKAAAAAKNGAPDVEKKVAPDTAGQEAKVVQ